MGWHDEVAWAVTHCNDKNVDAEIYRMSLAGCVYFIWQERNQMLFQNKR